MGTIQQFENLETWKESREMCQDIVEIREKSDLKTD